MKQYNYLYDNVENFHNFLQESKITTDQTAVLIQLFSSQSKEVLENTVSQITKELPNALIIGASTAGEIVHGTIYEQKTVISISIFEKTQLHAYYAVVDDSYALGKSLSKNLFNKNTKCVITFLDGLNHNGDEYLQGLESHNFQKAVIAGGMAGDLLHFKKTYTIFKNKIFSGGAVCVALEGEELEVFEDYNLGWRAVGPTFLITKADGSRVYEINNRPIKDVYTEVLGDFAVENMPASTIEFPLLYEDNGMLIARSMLNLNDDGSILYGGNIDEGQEVRFGIGSRNLVNKYNPKRKIEDEDALQACFIYSCVARKQFLGKELEKTFRIIEKKAPASGFFTYGEFFYSQEKPKFLNIATTLIFLREKNTQLLEHSISENRKFYDNSKTDNVLFHFIDYVTEELREQEKSFKASKFKLDEFLKALESVVIIARVDVTGSIKYVNGQFEEISGYMCRELIGKNYTILKSNESSEEDFDAPLEEIRKGRIWSGQLTQTAKDGTVFYLNTSIIPIHDEKHNILEYMVISEDVTDLVKSKQKAQEAEAAQSMFLANMSHEIRTPMNGIIGFSELLEKTELNKTQQKYVKVIGSSTKVLLDIVNDILDSSKITHKKIVLEKLSIDPYDEFRTTFELLQLSADEKSLTYLFDIDTRIANCIVSDSVRLRQIITNLLSNAIKFTPNFGAVSFKIMLKNDEKEQQNIRFSIKDSGVGIAESKIKEIFKPFTQADVSTTRKFGGTGLGLSISSDLLKVFGSELKVHSQEEEGSEFYFDIVFQKCHKSSASLEKDTNTSICDKANNYDKLYLNVLVAEDYDVNRMLIDSIFEKYENISLTFAVDGDDAIHKVEKKSYDLILMDINMPLRNGIEATKYIRKKLHLNIPIIALTANTLEGDKKRFLECGMDGYLSKPIEIDKLEEILHKYSKSQNQMNRIYIEEIVNRLRTKVGLSEEVSLNLLKTFLSSVHEILPELQEAIELKDVQKVYEKAHKLKGAAGALYIDNIYDLMKEIEHNALEKKVLDYSEELNAVTKHIKMIEQVLG